jgi:hypothetical protein
MTVGEIMPFGDSEHLPVRPSLARTLMLYRELRLQDPRLCRWSDQVGVGRTEKARGVQKAPIDPFPAILVEDQVDRAGTEAPPNDHVFRGIGWAALHSDVADPREDLMVLSLTRPLPAKRWHLTAETAPVERVRFAALFSVRGPGQRVPDLSASSADGRMVFGFGEDVRGEIGWSPVRDELVRVCCGEDCLKIYA